MQLLPSGLVVPPIWALLLLGGLAATEGVALSVLRPPVTGRQALAFAPWMVAGGIFHVLFQVGVVPAALAPLFAAPAVYVTTFVLLGAVWVGSVLWRDGEDAAGDGSGGAGRARERVADRTARDVGAAGAVLGVVLAALVYRRALALAASRSLLWPVAGVLVTLAVFAPLLYLLRARWPATMQTVGPAGAVAVFAHLLDGVSTAIGVDLLGTSERTPLPRHVMEFAGGLPTAPYLGRGWLFVVVKFLVATLIVALLADYVDEDPDEGNVLLAFVTALGLGPASNNLFLFVFHASS